MKTSFIIFCPNGHSLKIDYVYYFCNISHIFSHTFAVFYYIEGYDRIGKYKSHQYILKDQILEFIEL